MKKRIYALSISTLILFTSLTALTSCGKNENTDLPADTSVTSAATEGTTKDLSSDKETETKEESTTEILTYNDSHGYTVYSYVELTNAPTKPKPSEHTEKATAVPTTADAKEFPTVPEISNGLTCVRTQFASKGQIVTASIIMGTPGAEYTIEFYESEKRLSDSSTLKPKKADANGTVEWSFLIDDDCETGNRKLIIREKGTDKYIQTYITVNG